MPAESGMPVPGANMGWTNAADFSVLADFMEILEAMKLKLLKVKLKSKSKLELNVNEKFRFCALALVALVCVLGASGLAAASDEKDDSVPAMVAQYDLEPFPEEDADYTVNLGYYNYDGMDFR